jgi:hypothetical protein
MNIDRNSASVIGDRHGPIGMKNHGDTGTVPGQSLVYGVVYNLEDHVVQSSAIVGITDVHARALSDSIQTT